MADSDLPAALLTASQREFLQKTPADDSTPRSRSFRSRIRQRTRTSVTADMPLLLEGIETGAVDVEQLVEEEVVGDRHIGTDTLALGLRSTVAVVYQLARAARLDADRLISDGVEQGQTNHAELVYERFQEDPSSITLGELNLLIETGHIDQRDRGDVLDEILEGAEGARRPTNTPEADNRSG